MQFPSLSSQGLSPELEEKARVELGETADVKKKALEDLKRLIRNQFDSSKSTIDDVAAFALIIGEIDSQLESGQINGAHIIFDFKDCTIQQLYHLSSIRFVRMYSRYLQECWPCRVKGFHVINEPLSVHYICRIMCTFLSKKMKQRFHIHGDDVKSLHRYINPEVLPAELYGTAEPINPSEYQAFILSHEAYIQKLNQYGFRDN